MLSTLCLEPIHLSLYTISSRFCSSCLILWKMCFCQTTSGNAEKTLTSTNNSVKNELQHNDAAFESRSKCLLRHAGWAETALLIEELVPILPRGNPFFRVVVPLFLCFKTVFPWQESAGSFLVRWRDEKLDLVTVNIFSELLKLRCRNHFP